MPEAELGKKIILLQDQIRHLKVLRLKKGEKIRIFNGKGKEFEADYSEKVSSGIMIEKEVKSQEELKVEITLGAAVPKGGRMDFLVEKVSELGITNLVPILCERSVVKPGEAKIERLQRIASEACAQSGRSIVPTITKPVVFEELLKTIKNYDCAFICHPGGKRLTRCECKKELIIVGPEGGFTEEELTAAKEKGCIEVSLSPSILRTETASIAAIAQAITLSQKAYKEDGGC